MPTTPAIFIGRLSPLHKGHEAIITSMLASHGIENSLLVLGSVDAEPTDRTPYTAKQRLAMIEALFPRLAVETLPDYETDEEWVEELDSIIKSHGWNPNEVVFWGGSESDLICLIDAKRACTVVNRFDGTTPVISATQVRQALRNKEPIDTLVSPAIAALLEN